MQIVKMRDDEGNITGYNLGDYYLLKMYSWGNDYEWVLSQEEEYPIYHHERQKKIENGDLVFVDSFKEGMQKLIELGVNNEKR